MMTREDITLEQVEEEATLKDHNLSEDEARHKVM
jgi:hypothetical protein